MVELDFLIQAIQARRMLRVRFTTHQGDIDEKFCAPMDIGPTRKDPDGPDRIHFWVFQGADAGHTMSLLHERILQVELMDEIFDPADFVKWKPSWVIERDWGHLS